MDREGKPGAGNRIGRPTRVPRKTERRVQLGLKVRAEVKRLIDAEAKRTGWTQGATAEMLIEKQIAHQETLGVLKLNPDKLTLDQQEVILRSWGWTWDRGTHPDGTVTKRWYAPHPTRGPRFGWIPAEKGDDQ